MSDWPNITREDEARWPEETRVLMDLPFCVETVSGEDCELLLTIKCGQLSPYEMVDRNGRPSLFGLDHYRAWSGNMTPPMIGLAESLRQWAQRDCPLLGCEDFEGQRLVPRHLQRIGASDLTFDDLDRETALNLAAAINAPPRVLRFRNGAELTIHPEYVQPGDVVTLNGTQFRVGKLLEDPTPAYAAMELPRVELGPGAQMAELTARQHLERARPRRRLDGRR